MSFEFTANELVRWTTVRTLGNNLADRLRDGLIRISPVWGDHLSWIGSRNAALIDAVTTVTGASVFVDASKDHNRLRLLREYCEPDLYVIHLVRDAPAFVNSCIRKRKHPIPFARAIRWWNRNVWHMERLRSGISSDRWLLVRHEDICTNPGVELGKVLRFLGVGSPSPMLDFRSVAHHIIGNQMRQQNSSEIRLNTSWRTELPPAQLDEILKRTAKYRERLGYAG